MAARARIPVFKIVKSAPMSAFTHSDAQVAATPLGAQSQLLMPDPNGFIPGAVVKETG